MKADLFAAADLISYVGLTGGVFADEDGHEVGNLATGRTDGVDFDFEFFLDRGGERLAVQYLHGVLRLGPKIAASSAPFAGGAFFRRPVCSLMQHPYRLRFLLVVLLGAVAGAGVGVWAQSDLRISQGGRVQTCTARFFDSGGADNDHAAPGTTQSITICPDQPERFTRLRFGQNRIFGTLTIYDGETAAAPVLRQLTRLDNNTSPIVRASDGNDSGCLHVTFVSEGENEGWRADVDCVVACSEIVAEVVRTEPAIVAGTIDVCAGDEVSFTVRGVYAGTADASRDERALFTWFFQDGTVVSDTGLTSVTHRFDRPGGYAVEVLIEDEPLPGQTCGSRNTIDVPVRIASPPRVVLPPALDAPICPDTELDLELRTTPGEGVRLEGTEDTIRVQASRVLGVPLLDGARDENDLFIAQTFVSRLSFFQFAPDQRITAGTEIEEIFVEFDHSWADDLTIQVECPDGQTVTLFGPDPDFDVLSQTFGTVDQQGRLDAMACDGSAVSDLYTWVDATQFPTIPEAIGTPPGIPLQTKIPAVTYRPQESFGKLIGCSLNGTWQLLVTDGQQLDVGCIQTWGIRFREQVYPAPRTFVTPINNARWVATGSPITAYAPRMLTVRPTDAGRQSFLVEADNAYGCPVDTSVTVEIRSPLSPGCADCSAASLLTTVFRQDSICSGETTVAQLTLPADGLDTTVVFAARTYARFGSRLRTSDIGTVSDYSLTVDRIRPNQLADRAAIDRLIESVCMDFNITSGADLSELDVELVAPNGSSVVLVARAGASGESFRQTCFSPVATDALSTGAPAPYTGTFAATGNWSDLIGSEVNGDWSLRLRNDEGLLPVAGVLENWSIAFRHRPELTYAWDGPAGTLSCTDCPRPELQPTDDATHTLRVTDPSTGCEQTGTLEIVVSGGPTGGRSSGRRAWRRPRPSAGPASRRQSRTARSPTRRARAGTTRCSCSACRCARSRASRSGCSRSARTARGAVTAPRSGAPWTASRGRSPNRSWSPSAERRRATPSACGSPGSSSA